MRSVEEFGECISNWNAKNIGTKRFDNESSAIQAKCSYCKSGSSITSWKQFHCCLVQFLVHTICAYARRCWGCTKLATCFIYLYSIFGLLLVREPKALWKTSDHSFCAQSRVWNSKKWIEKCSLTWFRFEEIFNLNNIEEKKVLLLNHTKRSCKFNWFFLCVLSVVIRLGRTRNSIWIDTILYGRCASTWRMHAQGKLQLNSFHINHYTY